MKRVVLAAGALGVALVLRERRKNQKASGEARRSADGKGKVTQQLVHAWPGAAAASAVRDAGAQSADPSKAGGNSSRHGGFMGTTVSMVAMLWSSLLVLALALAAGSVALLALRGLPDLAAAVAVAWLLAAPAVLSLHRQSAAAAAAAAQAEADAASSDAVMVVEDAVVTAAAGAQPSQQLLEAFQGTWLKDAAASESMDAAMRLIHLNGLMRQAVKLIRGVQLRLEGEGFRFAVFSAISWFKITELFPWTGELHENRRRDMRRGRSRGRVEISPRGTLLVHYEWDSPHSGVGRDEFSIDEQGRLRLTTVVRVGDQTAGYVQVYVRRRQRGQSSSSGGPLQLEPSVAL